MCHKQVFTESLHHLWLELSRKTRQLKPGNDLTKELCVAPEANRAVNTAGAGGGAAVWASPAGEAGASGAPREAERQARGAAGAGVS